jgi:tetratricopeptide (TPR) repeat protein
MKRFCLLLFACCCIQLLYAQGNAKKWLAQGDSLYQLRKYAEAAPYLDKALADSSLLNDDKLDARQLCALSHMAIGDSMRVNGKLREAIEHYERAFPMLEYGDIDEKELLQLAKILVDNRYYSTAEACIDRIAEYFVNVNVIPLIIRVEQERGNPKEVKYWQKQLAKLQKTAK